MQRESVHRRILQLPLHAHGVCYPADRAEDLWPPLRNTILSQLLLFTECECMVTAIYESLLIEHRAQHGQMCTQSISRARIGV
mmetsp:Transcript_9738/g.25148  ORF Transcript_9738/g.25148 Transcript_9738/m.25148 type:complete len:83 (-) Transcript_9738:173-421(-)